MVVAGFVVLLPLLAAIFPSVFSVETDREGRCVEASAGASQLAAALKNYYTEYGHWPDFTGAGKFLDAEQNARLMHVLTAHDEVNDPRRIIFFEAKSAIVQHGAAGDRLSGGFDPTAGTFLDPWGNPYRIILDATNRGVIASPYAQDPDRAISASAIVWSLGKDGKQGDTDNEKTSNRTF